MPSQSAHHGRTASGANGTSGSGQQLGNGPTSEVQPAQAAPAAGAKSKKAKSKKTVDPNETGKLLAAKINQLEMDAAGEKDQEHEIEREVRKATRDLNQLLAAIGTPLEKMETLQKRYSDLMAEMKRTEREYVKGKKRSEQLQKERDAQRVELNKSNSVKEKLEKLAREFTKDNKKLKEDLKRLEESEKRSKEEMAAKDMQSLEEFTSVVKTGHGLEVRNVDPKVDEQFRQKFKSFLDQYNLRELHYLSVIRMKDAEIQHHLARLEHQRKAADSESSRARQLTTQVSTFSHTETELRNQLNIYVEKFKQVEDTLNNSNDLFLTFRKEMEEMSKKTKRLEKENLNLTRKHELTNRNIVEMVGERERMTKELEAERKKNATLESIIRRMQDQGRNAGLATGLDVDEDATESDYDDSEDEGDYVGSEEVEYDDETEDDLAVQGQNGGQPPTFGPVPPPPSVDSATAKPRMNGAFNGKASSQRFDV